MIDLNELFIQNSLQANRTTFVPKRYIAGLGTKFIGQKFSDVFRAFVDTFKSSQVYRKELFDFIENTFVLGDAKRIIKMRDPYYLGMSLSSEWIFSDCYDNGVNIINNIIGKNEYDTIDEEFLRKVTSITLEQVETYCSIHGTQYNCGINQSVFDFVIARECYFDKAIKTPEEISKIFFQLLYASEVLHYLVDNVRFDKKTLCLDVIKNLSINSFDPSFNFVSVDDLKNMNVEQLYCYMGNNFGSLINVLNYFSSKPENVISDVFNNFLYTLNDEEKDMITRRETETLESIGQSYNLTRERVRQKERDSIAAFNEFYDKDLSTDNKNFIFIFPRLIPVYPLHNEENTLGVFYGAFRTLMKEVKFKGEAKYYKELDAVIEYDDIYNLFNKIVNNVFGDYVVKTKIEEKMTECLETLGGYGFDRRTIQNFLDNTYRDKGSYILKKGVSLSKAERIERILLKHFDQGFHFSDDDHIRQLNTYALEEFGDVIFTDEEIAPTYHTIQSILDRTNSRLVGQGTYTHSSKAPVISEALLQKVLDYLRLKNCPLGYSDIFTTFEAEMLSCGITNKYALQGALSVYRDVYFKCEHHYITPINMSLTLREMMAEWIKTRPALFTYDDFKTEFKGVAASVFMSSIYEVGDVAYFWQQGYIGVDKLNIDQFTQTQIKNILDNLINAHPNNFCSADEIFDAIKSKMPNLITDNNMRYSYDLFSVLQILFKGEFKFKRPLIGHNNAVFEDIYGVIDSYLSSKDTVQLSDLRKMIDTSGLQPLSAYVSVSKVLSEKWNEFVPIDKNTITRKENIHLQDRELIKLDVMIDLALQQSYKVRIKEDIIEHYNLVEIAKMKTNPYLIFGLVNTFLHDKYKISIEDNIFKNGIFSIQRR